MATKALADLRVVIIGAGFCGLTTAIECKLRGMYPIVIEAYHGIGLHGDMIDFVENAGRVFEKWKDGEIAKKLRATGANASRTLDIYNADDILLGHTPFVRGVDAKATFGGQRGKMLQVIWDYAAELGVELHNSTRVSDYIDTETERGIVTTTGQRILGDVVLACDGARSAARSKLMHLKDSTVNSGYAIFRAYFELTPEVRENPYIKMISSDEYDVTRWYVGRDLHGFIYNFKNSTHCSWVLTHIDEADIGESWNFPGKKEDVLKHLDKSRFPDIWREVLKLTPEDRLFDYKLAWRDPLKTWLSPTKRCALLGDAAHSHLPTSSQGGCQAIEDAATVAICLERANGNVPLALQVFERIRFNRSHVIHQSSISTRVVYHKFDWTPETVKKYPDSLKMPIFEWINGFDCQKAAEENFDHLAQDIRSGKQGTIEELSLPAGGNYDRMFDPAKDKNVEISSLSAPTATVA